MVVYILFLLVGSDGTNYSLTLENADKIFSTFNSFNKE